MYRTLEGIFGTAVDVSSSLIILFTMYGAFLQHSGAGKFYLDWSFAATGSKHSGAGRTLVLGAAAFLIAEFLKISYLDVLLMATVPTLLYYLSLFLQARRHRPGAGGAGVATAPRRRLRDQLLPVLRMQRGSLSHLSSQYCMYIFCSQMKRLSSPSFPHFSSMLP